MNRPIFIAASPNSQKDDVALATKLMLQPWLWYKEEYSERFREELRDFLEVQNAFLLDSARSGLYVGLKSLGIGSGDEVILPSFTCVVVANAVSWTGAKPIYLDTNKNDFNANYDSLTELLNEKTKAILVQHTFGKRVDVKKIKKLLVEKQREDILIIEDFAHTMHRRIQLDGDFGILTFGIEKVISSIRGGAIITNDENISSLIRDRIEKLPRFPRKKTFISLTNPIFWYIATPLHGIKIGKLSIGAFVRWIWRKLGFLGIQVEKEENLGEKPEWLPTKIAPALALLGNNQLRKLDTINKHRNKIAKLYSNYFFNLSDSSKEDAFNANRVYLRYPILLSNSSEKDKINNIAKKLGITLGDWYTKPLYGKGVGKRTYKKLCYAPSSTPVTASKTSRVLNLPTSVNISLKRAKELSEEIKKKTNV